MVICGEEDDELVGRLNALSKKWGGKFSASYCDNWKKYLRNFKGVKVHLTMYGEDFRKIAKKLGTTAKKPGKNKLVLVVGAGKVPPDAYQLSDYNVAVGNQPHSEVAAIALFLYELGKRKLDADFSKAVVRIIPTAKGKRVADARKD